jgi:hypothetical protein
MFCREENYLATNSELLQVLYWTPILLVLIYWQWG